MKLLVPWFSLPLKMQVSLPAQPSQLMVVNTWHNDAIGIYVLREANPKGVGLFSFRPMSRRMNFFKDGTSIVKYLSFIALLFASPAWALDYSKIVSPFEEPDSKPNLVRPNMLPDGEVLSLGEDKGEAWLSHPTERYAHGVLGDAIEAGGITYSQGTKSLVLNRLSVFEDRKLRMADLDGDGTTELIVVKSYLDQGAAIAAIGLVDGVPQIIAETDPIGLSNRWLNPVGVADFDGDGKVEVAAVITPHIGGTLKLYGFKEGKFFLKYAQEGFSNHAYGSRELGMSAIGDVNMDGIPELFIPDENRRDIRVVSFKGNAFQQLTRIKGSGPITGPLEFVPGKRPQLTYSLKSNERVTITFTP
ncbi:MAG: VCBS repeat-containing protein [Alphaproteobacteria bacterium]|nr:VCBS repeat-containing protein [Rhodospirillales bacterium]MCW9045522.1 VCBS repeat-containing protein [Alphaproteobacteria bacterium]